MTVHDPGELLAGLVVAFALPVVMIGSIIVAVVWKALAPHVRRHAHRHGWISS